MNIDYKSLARSLRVIVENPKKIEEANGKYSAKLVEIAEKEKTGYWSPNMIAREKEEARKSRDRVCHSLAHSMRSALEDIKKNNNLAEQPLDIKSYKIQSAINVLSYMGKDLTFADQASMLESFRGDPASLRFLESAFKKNGLDYAANIAKEMYRPISNQAISEMETVLDFHDYHETKDEFVFPIERAQWTKGEFSRHMERLGMVQESTDPYIAALDDAASFFASEVDDPNTKGFYHYVAQQAKKEINDGEKSSINIFNNAIENMELKSAHESAKSSEIG